MKKEKIIIIILVILLIAMAGYIGVQKFLEYNSQKQLDAFQRGANYGYGQAIIQVIQQASTCREVPLFVGNSTTNVIAVDCLKKTG